MKFNNFGGGIDKRSTMKKRTFSSQGKTLKKRVEKCKKVVKKLSHLALSLKNLSPSEKKFNVTKKSLYRDMVKVFCSTNKCKDHKKKVVNGFNKRYSKKTINGFRKMGLISACK
jgi:hypothetical protein